jgi:hypothetical protein
MAMYVRTSDDKDATRFTMWTMFIFCLMHMFMTYRCVSLLGYLPFDARQYEVMQYLGGCNTLAAISILISMYYMDEQDIPQEEKSTLLDPLL